MSQEIKVPAPIKLDRSHIETINVSFSFLTYVFGGGVEHHKNEPELREAMRPFDPITPIRPTGVRGVLRMWWRYTTGVRCQNLEEMRRREAALWGGVWEEDTPSQVGVTVDTRGKTPSEFPVFEWGRSNFPQVVDAAKGLEYGAFPLRPEGNNSSKPDRRSSLWNHGDNVYRLSLDLQRPDALKELKLALSAWLTVGGYGARTSRGFGAVKLEVCDHDGVTDDPAVLRQMLAPLGPPRVKGVPALVADEAHWALRGQPGHPQKAWANCLRKMQAFRQNRRSGSGPRPGRSYWPEPDAIRRETRRSSPEHSTPVSKIDAFPRADFGMPIIFHFKDRDDPRDQSLQPSKNVDRYPSPVILRPSSKGQAMAVHLANTAAPEELCLSSGYQQARVRKSPTRGEMEQATDKERSLFEPNAITAFLNTFRG